MIIVWIILGVIFVPSLIYIVVCTVKAFCGTLGTDVPESLKDLF
jgi:hypothetical protein